MLALIRGPSTCPRRLHSASCKVYKIVQVRKAGDFARLAAVRTGVQSRGGGLLIVSRSLMVSVAQNVVSTNGPCGACRPAPGRPG